MIIIIFKKIQEGIPKKKTFNAKKTRHSLNDFINIIKSY